MASQPTLTLLDISHLFSALLPSSLLFFLLPLLHMAARWTHAANFKTHNNKKKKTLTIEYAPLCKGIIAEKDRNTT